jgi:hypothetical protein
MRAIPPGEYRRFVLDVSDYYVILTLTICMASDSTLEGPLALKPHFDPHTGEGSVTAGNSSQLSDGASATLLMSRECAYQLGVPNNWCFVAFKLRVAIRTKWASVLFLPSLSC